MTSKINANWYADPLGRYEMRYHNGERWTSRVSSAGTAITDPEPPPSEEVVPPEASTVLSSGMSDKKRQQMGIVAMVCGGVIFLGMFLPWASSSVGSVTGVGAGLGFITGICGVVIALYGAQIFRPGPIRYHPGALTAIIIVNLFSTMAYGVLEELDTATLGTAGVDVGAGLYLTFLAGLVAIWPLVVFWRDYRAQRRAMHASLVPGAHPASGS